MGARGPGPEPLGPIIYIYIYIYIYMCIYIYICIVIIYFIFVVRLPFRNFRPSFFPINLASLTRIVTIQLKNLTKTIKIVIMMIVF